MFQHILPTSILYYRKYKHIWLSNSVYNWKHQHSLVSNFYLFTVSVNIPFLQLSLSLEELTQLNLHYFSFPDQIVKHSLPLNRHLNRVIGNVSSRHWTIDLVAFKRNNIWNLTFTASQTSPDKSLCDWSRAIVSNLSKHTRHTTLGCFGVQIQTLENYRSLPHTADRPSKMPVMYKARRPHKANHIEASDS